MTTTNPTHFRLVDSHCHLQAEPLASHVGQNLAEARRAGVLRAVCNGTSESDWTCVAECARLHSGIVPVFGLHPWFVGKRSPDWLDRLADFLRDPRASMGEIGLDRWIEPRDEKDQEDVFRQQLALSRQLGKPVTIHCLKAWDRLLAILKETGGHEPGLLLHAFAGSVRDMRALERLDACFSFCGAITYRKNKRAREAAAACAPARFLLETDAPDFLPAGADASGIDACNSYNDNNINTKSTPPNRPALLPLVVRTAADLRGELPEATAALSTRNAIRFFGLQEIEEYE